jgi:hypothetical protein
MAVTPNPRETRRMTTLPMRLRPRHRDPAAVVVDDIGVRVVGHRRSAAGKTILELELDVPPAPGRPLPPRRPPKAPVPIDERREEAAVAISVLGGFAFVSAVASLIVILL